MLAAQLHEVHGIAGNADGQVRVLLRMLVGCHQRLAVENVDVQMMRVLREITAHDGDEVIDLLVLGLAECARRDGERVGDTIAAVGVAQLCHRVQGGERAGNVAAAHRVRARRERFAVTAAVRRVAGLFYHT